MKSPFRYPGGKYKISKTIISRISDDIGEDNIFDEVKIDRFVDVFAGGGSVSMGFINQYPCAEIVMNDMDDWIFSFWKSFQDEKEYRRLVSYVNKYEKPTVEDFVFLRKVLLRDGLKTGYKGFLAWFFNRTTFSGIFRSGPIGGFDQKGKYKIDCRYNPVKAKKVFEDIRNKFADEGKVTVFKEDFRDIIRRYQNDERAFLYLDPPYMKQGHQLYSVFMQDEDFVEMADMLRSCKCKWVVSHDDYKPFVRLFGEWSKIYSILGVPYTINSIEGKRKTELLISSK